MFCCCTLVLEGCYFGVSAFFLGAPSPAPPFPHPDPWPTRRIGPSHNRTSAHSVPDRCAGYTVAEWRCPHREPARCRLRRGRFVPLKELLPTQPTWSVRQGVGSPP